MNRSKDTENVSCLLKSSKIILFAEALAGRIFKECFKWLDGPVEVLGAANIPAIPLNMNLENVVLPDAEKVSEKIKNLLAY